MEETKVPTQGDGANALEEDVKLEGGYSTEVGHSVEEGSGGEGEKDAMNDDEGGSGTPDSEQHKILTAVYPILYLSRQYKIGEELPANDPGMVEAWIEAGTAVWQPAKEPAVKAKSRTAESGLPGQAAASESEDGDNLAGRIPKTQKRKR